jgi:hypothetical protein
MNNPSPTHPQDLREAFASIITMILGLLRAHGLRGLRHVPALWLAAREIRRGGEEFVALLDAFRAGALPSVAAPRTARNRRAPNLRATNLRATNLRAVRFARAYRVLGPRVRRCTPADILVSARCR